MRVHFFGTSAGVPSLRRGLPSAGIEREGELFLFDCGEGTQLSLQRSPVKASKMAAALISHMHGDHVMGLPGLLMSLQMAGREDALVIAGPAGLREFVNGCLRSVHARLNYPLEFKLMEKSGVVMTTPEYEIVADFLDHGVPCLGYALRETDRPGRFNLEAAQALGVPPGPLFGKLQHGEAVTLPDGRIVTPDEVLGPTRPGRRIAYVTDTRFCPGALELAARCDLLIHEATFASDRQEEAEAKGHSTIRDAARVAVASGTKSLALTHLSPRYDTSDPLLEEARSLFAETWIAEDRMVIEMDRDGGSELLSPAKR